MTAWLRDLRYAWRALRGNPGFTVAALVTMSVAVAAATAVFSIFNAVLLRPLPIPGASAIVAVGTTTRDEPAALQTASLEEVEDWQRASRTVAAFAAWRDWGMLRHDGSRRDSVFGIAATPALFDVFPLRPVAGRLLTADDDRPGAHAVVVLTYKSWHQQFGGDPGAIGRTLVLERGPAADYTIVGVLPAVFNEIPSFARALVVVPSASDPDARTGRAHRNRLVFARLRDATSLTAARGELQVIAGQLSAQYPASNAGRSIRLVSALEYEAGPMSGTLRAFMTAVALLVLIAGANVAGLQLARGVARRREFSIRRALGASRGALVRAIVSETLLLSTAAAVAGLLASGWLVELALVRGPALPRAAAVPIDARVVAFTVVAALLSSLLLALPAALMATRVDVARALKEESGQIAGSRAVTTRTVFVAVQAALALMLVVGAASAGRALTRQLAARPGFAPDGLAWMSLSPPMARYQKGAQVADLYARIIAAARDVPGVAAVSAVSATPLSGEGAEPAEFTIEGRAATGEARPRANTFNVAPGYFQALAGGITRGRDFAATDTADALPVAVVNDAFVRRYLGSLDPLAAALRLGPADPPVQIVGVAPDVLQTVTPHAVAQPEIYLPYSQRPRWATLLVVRTTAPAPALALAAIRDRVAAIDPQVRTGTPVLMNDRLQRAARGPRFITLLFGFFAAVALLLSATGMAGLVLYTTAQRSRELAVRVSLGASGPDLVRVVGKGAFAALAAGSAAGVVGSLAVSRLMAALLTDLDPAGPALSAAAALLFFAVGAVACYLPARRATRTDPAAVMRG